ncbi:MAG TPA: hypothetical protein VF008_11290 [Niastella sp.]
MRHVFFCLCCSLLLCNLSVMAQTGPSLPDKIIKSPDKLIEGLNKRVNRVQQHLWQQTNDYLCRLMRQEERLKKKLARKDPAMADSLFANSHEYYAGLKQRTDSNHLLTNVYSSRLDSLTTALQFMDKSGLLPNAAGQQQVAALLSKYNELQGSFNQTEKIKKALAERQQQLQQQLQIPGFNKWQQQYYYYTAQVKAIKLLWEDPSALEQRLTGYLCQLPPFRQYFAQHSQLAQVFQLPGNTASLPVNTTLQTRDALNQMIQAGGVLNGNIQGQLQNNLPAATSPLNELLPGNLPLTAGNTGSVDLPGFKPNNQRTRSFLKRLELGTTLQTSKTGYFFPTTTDLGITAGYRLNDKSTIGIGSSGKIGWGKGWQAIRVSGEGVALRSFADIKLKGSIWITGGWEYHYQQPFSEIRALHNIPDWKQEALLGISKIISIKSNAFKKYRIQLLYDFLHNQQLPVTEPVKFRMGYLF